mmetsp:Transcript_9756/g.19580  ORF Transcript_9756/g.19580 Transcript_9756/m.19580 type:complete len:191 (-) Transcript_9756:301-873(-)
MGRHPCESCGEEGWDYCENLCPRECDYNDGRDICEKCFPGEKECSVQGCYTEGCGFCVEEHCQTCKHLVCPDCDEEIEQRTFGCGHDGCTVLEYVKPDEDEEPEDGAADGAVSEDKVPAFCPKCVRAQEATRAEKSAKAAVDQYRKDLPSDLALVESILSQVKTVELRALLVNWRGSAHQSESSNKKRKT